MLRDPILVPRNLKQEDGVLYYFDVSRSKWLSVQRDIFEFGHNHRNIPIDMWLRMVSGIPSNITGYPVPRDSVITGVSVKTQNLSDCTFRVRKNGSLTNIVSIILSGSDLETLKSLDINLDEGDFIQCYLEVTSGKVDYPVAEIEIASRTN